MENGSTAKRKGHNKSRNGCIQCKRRRVKCNEQRPECAPCQKLSLPCSWRLSPTTHAVAALLAPKQTPTEQSSSPAPEADSDNALLVAELGLLHHWILKTAVTLSVPNTRHLWQNTMVELGLRHPFLLHAILGVAAIHKAALDKFASAQFHKESLRHMNCAISQFSEHLSDIDITMCSPMFLTSGLITIHSIATAQVQRPADPLLAMCEWMKLTRGTKHSLHKNWDQIQSLEIAPLILPSTPSQDIKHADPVLGQLLNCVTDPQSPEGSARDWCIEAVTALQNVSDTLEQAKSDETRNKLGIASAWPALVDPGFFDLILDRYPMALIIVAWYAGLLHGHAHIWYVRGWAEMILDAVRVALPQDLRGWLEWPQQCLQTKTP